MAQTPNTVIMNPQMPLVVLHPANPREHSHTVIFLHGENETARRSAERIIRATSSTGQTLRQEFPTIRWVFPMAQDANKKWFATGHRLFPDHNPIVQIEGLYINVVRIRALIDREAATLNDRYHRVVIAGFSHGASVAAHILLNLKIPDDNPHPIPRLGGLFCLAGRFPFAGHNMHELRHILNVPNRPRDNAIVYRTPILIQHNHDDGVYAIRLGREFCDALGLIGANPVWREYTRGGHWFGGISAVDDLIAFLGTALGIGRWGQNRGDVVWAGRLPMPSRVEVADFFGHGEW
ncbi:hypothetical protein ACHAPT_005602 [Fusarium lateritium]